MDNRQNIGADRKREDVPTGWICGVAELTGFSMDWLGFGKGPKMRVDYTTEGFLLATGIKIIRQIRFIVNDGFLDLFTRKTFGIHHTRGC